MRLHFYSNFARERLPVIEEEEVYRIDEIKEFETISPKLKQETIESLQLFIGKVKNLKSNKITFSHHKSKIDQCINDSDTAKKV